MMTSISQRDHDELIAAFKKQREQLKNSPEVRRKSLVRIGFGNYCDGSDGEIKDADNFIPCSCKFCDSERKKQYETAVLQHSRLARSCGFFE
ncbi:MAG: hypothetical protein ABS85_16160 [Sphingobacteriales bacterium SCN 48-20]|nr:MAG: hypothetical protein ABS85_16160 [Sphingobacteriales bacterium SCN 48-20]OJW45397.1 MAG: hypothetical protein BGO56_02430 [Sphingobacteriales bacterium 48-107]